MAYTPYYSQGVKFIKIARTDEQGNDNTLSLQELDNIRIKFSDVGIVEYPITSISKYDTYFLFGVAPTEATSSINNEILNYRASASYSRQFTSGTSYILSDYGTYGGESYDDLGYFNLSTGRYTLGNQPNIPIIVKVSASITSSLDEVTTILYINSSINGTVASQSYYVPTGTTRTVMTASYTTTPAYGEYFYLSFSPGATTNFTGSFFVTQSTSPQTGIQDLVVLEPFVDENFVLSNYNVLAGDALEPRLNSFYMDVDYATNAIQAVNQVQLLSGSATRAAVQDSNYTIAGIIIPRYLGKELTSAVFNEWTEGDISYGKTPNVSNPEVNFVYFNTLGGTSPQWGNNNADMTQVGINYIVNNNGNATKPINDSKGINLGTIQQSFEESKNAILALDNSETSGANLSVLNGTWPIYKSGYRIEPILYTQTASYNSKGDITGFGYFPTMSFVQGEQGPNVSKNDYMMYAAGTNDIITFANYNNVAMAFPAGLHFTSVNIGASGSLCDNIFIAYSGSIYNPTGSLGNLKTEGYILDFRVKLVSDTISAATITYALQKSINGGSSWSDLVTTQVNYAYSLQQANDLKYSRDANMFYQERNATTSSLYRVAVINGKQYTQESPPQAIPPQSPIYLNNNSYFWITQYPNPGVGTCKSPFWTTGSSANILLASTASDGLNNYRNQKQKDIENSGFIPISLDFEPQVYDEIRFEGLEQLSFAITAVTSSNNQMILNLDQEIPNGVNLDYFLLRRYVEDPSSIILDVNFPLTDNSGSINSAGNGILKPQYITKELESNIDTIVQNLKNQNLI